MTQDKLHKLTPIQLALLKELTRMTATALAVLPIKTAQALEVVQIVADCLAETVAQENAQAPNPQIVLKPLELN